MADAIEEEIQRLRHELQMVTKLVEWLYTAKFGELSNGPDMFNRFSETVKADLRRLTVPGADPTASDHTTQGWLEAISPILERISESLKSNEGQAS